MSDDLDFWKDVIGEAADESEATLTDKQIVCFAKAAQSAHEYYGMSFYQPSSSEPNEIHRLQRELRIERAKVVCDECSGRGRLIFSSGPWAVNQHCSRCNGDGKVSP